MKELIQNQVFEIVKSIYPDAVLKLEEIDVSYPPEEFGDYSSNVAMKLAGKLKKNPMEVAEEIKNSMVQVTNLNQQDIFEKIEIAKPGFLNFFLDKKVFLNNLEQVISLKDEYGKNEIGNGKTVMVEFGQPNTHKAFHVGHLRSAISGLAVAKMYEASGYTVIKANYFGDIGMHVAKTTWAMSKTDLPADFESWDKHEKMKFIDSKYVEGSNAFKEDPNAEREIRKINTDIYQGNETPETSLYKKIRQWSLEHLEDIFKSLGITYDRQFPESEVYRDAIGIVKKYQGKIFTESEGAVIYDGSKEGLTTWVFLTKEGNPTYSAKDLALALKKFSEFDLDFAVVTTSVEQSDYFKVIIHCLQLINPDLRGKYIHVPFGWLLRGHKKTSSRMGDSVKGVDVIDEAKSVAKEKISVANEYDEKTRQEIIDRVALSGLKFLILSHEFHGNINYDPDEFIKLKGYSGPFILYSYVRTQSVLRKANIQELSVIESYTKRLTKEEKDLMKSILIFPEVVSQAGTQIAPHLLCNYLYDLAQRFNVFYENCSILSAEDELTKNFRLALAKAAGQVLKNGLNMLGIETVEVM